MGLVRIDGAPVEEVRAVVFIAQEVKWIDKPPENVDALSKLRIEILSRCEERVL